MSTSPRVSAPGWRGAASGAGSLAGVCPEKLVIQTDWNPESEHGGIYEMVGDGYKVDAAKKIVTGPLVSGGKDTGVQIEIRTGGPAIGSGEPPGHRHDDHVDQCGVDHAR